MSAGRTELPPAVTDAARRLGSVVGALVLACYGLVHLLIWPGAPTGTPGERYRWNGQSWLLGWLPDGAAHAAGGVLLAATLLGHGAAAVGLAGLPGARRHWLAAVAVGAACSLALLAAAWPGLEPTPAEFDAGPVISGLLLACACATAWARQHSPTAVPRRG